MSAELVAAWLRAAAQAIHARRDWLTELDAAIGDGDHGINLDRGFELVAARLELVQPGDVGAGALLQEAGRIVLGSVGGASGALYGRAFARAGATIVSKRESVAGPVDAVVRALDAAADAIATLGRAAPGDKTMIDALDPARRAMRTSASEGRAFGEAVARAAAAADAGAAATFPLVARRGRASYLGDRSRDHLDPGAASMAILLRALADTVGAR